jgi:serine phosphatase RsbU (regulator of sigma subunit)
MAHSPYLENIDDYLRKRLAPVEGAIPHIAGIEIFGLSLPAGSVGGDLFEYINFQQRYDIDERIQQARRRAKEFLESQLPNSSPRNSVDDHIKWLKTRGDYRSEMESEYRRARSLEQIRIAEDLQSLHEMAGLLVVDAQGHGIISAKIASTVHDTFHAFLLSELDHHGKTTPSLFESVNVRLAQSVIARNALGASERGFAREIATMLYGEVHPQGYFRFVNFGHPAPMVFSAEYQQFMQLDESHMVRFLPLGLQIPSDHPDRLRYTSMQFRKRRADTSDVAEIALMNTGDILFLYTDGVFDGADGEERQRLETVIGSVCRESARTICEAILEYARHRDEKLGAIGEEDLIDDKTVFIVKRMASGSFRAR